MTGEHLLLFIHENEEQRVSSASPRPGCRLSVGVRNPRLRSTKRSTRRGGEECLQSGVEKGGIASQSATCARQRADDGETRGKKGSVRKRAASGSYSQTRRHMAAVCRALGRGQERRLVTRCCCPSRAAGTPGSFGPSVPTGFTCRSSCLFNAPHVSHTPRINQALDAF